jgi:hypothetical protein
LLAWRATGRGSDAGASMSASLICAGTASGLACGPTRRKPSPSDLNRPGAARNTIAATAAPAISQTQPGVPCDWLRLVAWRLPRRAAMR